MIRVKADPKNKQVLFGLDNISKGHKRAIRTGAFDIGRRNQLDIRKNIKLGAKTGRAYRIGGKVHRASAAGEAPAQITGNLTRSATYNVRGHKQVEFGYGAAAHYGEYLEDGTRHMKERPNIKRVADDNAQTFINYMVRAYNAD